MKRKKMAILRPNKADIRAKKIARYTKEHIMMKE